MDETDSVEGSHSVLYEPVTFKGEESFGSLEMYEKESGDLVVTFTNTEGKVVQLADLVPFQYRLVGEGYNHHIYLGDLEDYSCIVERDKIIFLSKKNVDEDGWLILLTLFHEIAHAYQFNRDPSSIPDIKKDLHLTFRERNKKNAMRERQAWAIAIYMFKLFAKENGIPLEGIFSPHNISKYIREESLERKVEGYLSQMTSPDVHMEEPDILDEDLDELYEEIRRNFLGARAHRR